MRGQDRDEKRERNKGEIIRNAGNSGYENMQTIKNYVCPTNRESPISIRQLSNAHQKKKAFQIVMQFDNEIWLSPLLVSLFASISIVHSIMMTKQKNFS